MTSRETIRPYINTAISVCLVAAYLHKNGTEFLFGLFTALPFSWLIVFLIFRVEQNRNQTDNLSLGNQLSFFTNAVFSAIRFFSIILLALGQLLFKNTLTMQTYFDNSAPDALQMLSLLYVVLGSLLTELLFISIVFDFIKIITKKDVYSLSYNPKWKSNVANISVIIPFLIILTIVMGIAIPITLEKLAVLFQ